MGDLCSSLQVNSNFMCIVALVNRFAYDRDQAQSVSLVFIQYEKLLPDETEIFEVKNASCVRCKATDLSVKPTTPLPHTAKPNRASYGRLKDC